MGCPRDPNRPRHGLTCLLCLALALSLPAALPACQGPTTRPAPGTPASEPKVHLKSDRLSPEELERLNRAFADRYVMRLSTACDLILQDNPNEDQCRQIRDIRASGAMGIYDIVTDPDPYLQTLNLTVTVTLQWIAWVEEGRAEKVFGPRGRFAVEAVQTAHAEVRDLAAKIFSPSEMATLDNLIRAWRRQNLGITRLAYARFTDFINSAEEGGAIRDEASGLFAEIEQARQTVDEARALVERSLYIAKRMPLLLAWRSQSTFDELTATHAMTQALADFHTLAGAAATLPATLDAQRQALVHNLDQRQPALDATVKNVREALAQAQTLTTDTKSLLLELQKTMRTFENLMQEGDTLARRYLPAPPPASASSPAGSQPVATVPGAPPAATRPLDIQDYTAAIREASQAARDLNTVLVSSQKLLDSPAWQSRINEINAAADGRVRLASEESHLLVESVFTRVYIALGAFLVLLFLARLALAWLLKQLHLHK